MLSRRVVNAAPLRQAALAASRLPIVQQRTFLPPSLNDKSVIDQKFPAYPALTEAEDPNQNGAFVQPLPIKRQFRDPYADWWDKQERRNYGEPVHEDHDMMGMFTPHEYTWVAPGKGLVQIGAFVVTFLGLLFIVKQTYPDKPVYPREFEGGLERELGGSGAIRARAPGDPEPYQQAEAEE